MTASAQATVSDQLTALEKSVTAALGTYWALAKTKCRGKTREVVRAYRATETLMLDFTGEVALSRRTGHVRTATRNAAQDVIAQAHTLRRVAAQSR